MQRAPFYRKRSVTEQTAVPDDEDVDCGMEWPLNENEDVAQCRKFYQVYIYNNNNYYDLNF